MNRIDRSIEVNVPLRTVYNQWTQFEDFPRFMEGVREVRQLDAAHLHWRAARNGMEVEWDSEITDQVPDHHIAWRDTSGPKNAGSITFQPVQPDKTRIQMTISCHPGETTPEAEHAAQVISQRLEEDLARFKKLLESEGRESGAWSGEIHEGRQVGAQAAREFDAVANPMEKPVGQTGSERRDAEQSGAGQSDSDESMPGREQAQSDANRGSGVSSKAGSPQWLPNMLQSWEDPRAMVKRMSEEMDQLFERFIGRPMASRLGQGGTSGKWMPPVEVVQREGQLIIYADLPGVKREDVQIEINLDKLTIEGERREERLQSVPQGYRKSERSYGNFYRMIPLPAGADAESIQASMSDGVLEITVPVPASTERRGRRIDIQPPH